MALPNERLCWMKPGWRRCELFILWGLVGVDVEVLPNEAWLALVLRLCWMKPWRLCQIRLGWPRYGWRWCGSSVRARFLISFIYYHKSPWLKGLVEEFRVHLDFFRPIWEKVIKVQFSDYAPDFSDPSLHRRTGKIDTQNLWCARQRYISLSGKNISDDDLTHTYQQFRVDNKEDNAWCIICYQIDWALYSFFGWHCFLEIAGLRTGQEAAIFFNLKAKSRVRRVKKGGLLVASIIPLSILISFQPCVPFNVYVLKHSLVGNVPFGPQIIEWTGQRPIRSTGD